MSETNGKKKFISRQNTQKKKSYRNNSSDLLAEYEIS